MKSVRLITSLTIASIKMYFRNTSAVFFTLFIPIMLVAIFGFLAGGDGAGSLKVGLTNYSDSEISKNFVKAVREVKLFKVEEIDEAEARERLGKNQLDLQLVVPINFGQIGLQGVEKSEIKTYFNEGKPQNGQTANLVLGQIVSGFNAQLVNVPQLISLKTEGVRTNNLTYVDYLLPGIIAMSMMQIGVFSVAFGFISFKTSGALRRLQATPVKPFAFLFAQSVTRLLIGVLQVVILLGLGVWLFQMHLIGSVIDLLVVATLGTIMFLGFGFAVAGYAADENQAAPIANLVTFPMLFLSGTFFPRDAFPEWLRTISDYFPLTYLSDALRVIANEGASLWAVRGDLLGIIIWSIIGYLTAIRFFSWE